MLGKQLVKNNQRKKIMMKMKINAYDWKNQNILKKSFVKVRNLDPINFEKGTRKAIQFLYCRSKAD